MKRATNSVYKQVYRPDVVYHYSVVPENIISIRGQEYFNGMKMTGSNRGTLLQSKYDLITNHRNIVIPAMKNGGNEIIGRCSKNIYDKILDGPSMLLLREKIAYLHQQEVGNHGWLFAF